MLQKILFSNFLGQNRQGSPNLNELLEKQDSLTRLLDEESFLSEFKSGSARTKEYMNYDRFVELTQMITIVGDENDKKRAYKFPLTVCDLLTSDNTKIQQLFLPASNRVIVEEKIIKTIEKEVEQEIDDDEEEPDESKPEEAQDKIEGKEAEDGTALVTSGEEKKKEGGDEEEEFGDFVEAPSKKKKVVKVKEVVEITETLKHEKQPVINKLFEYFSRPINYTLTGYVSKVLVSLLNRKTLSFLARLFENPGQSSGLFRDIFSHLGSRSTVDLLTRVYTIENKSYLEQRYQLLLSMIDYLKEAESIDALANIAICVSEVFEKTNAHLKLGNPIKELSLYNNRIPDLLSRLLEFFVGDNENASTYSISIICQLLSYFNIKDSADKLSPFLNQYLLAVTNQLKKYLEVERSRIGPHAIRLVQSLNLCLKSDAVLDQLIANEEIYPTLLALVRKYPLNNIFHNQVFRFLTGSLSSGRSELASNVVNSTGLIQWLQQEAKHQQQRQQAKKAAKKGYFGHLFNFCQYLRQNAGKDPAISNITQHEKFIYIVKILLEQEAALAKKMLGGFSKKETKHTVMHSKESILEAHATFLASAPSAVLEKDLDDPTLNPILLEQLQRQLDGVELPNQSQPEEVVQEEKHKAELIDENQHHKAAFWKVHLDYDVDGLIDELI